MESRSPAPVARPKSSSRSTTIIVVLFVVLVIPLIIGVGFMQNFNQMSPHEQSFFRAMGTDFITGHWAFSHTKETAQRNFAESKQRSKESHRKEDIADQAYQKALEEQKQAVAEAAKRKAKQ